MVVETIMRIMMLMDNKNIGYDNDTEDKVNGSYYVNVNDNG